MRGSCLCGGIKFEAGGLMFGTWACSCRHCRKFHGAAFSFQVNVLEHNFRWLAGEGLLAGFEKIAGTGERHFCRRCSSPMPSSFTPGVVGVPAAVLDGDELPVRIDAMFDGLPRWAVAVCDVPTFPVGALPLAYTVGQWNRIGVYYLTAVTLHDAGGLRDVAAMVDMAQRQPGFSDWRAAAWAALGPTARGLLGGPKKGT